MRYIPPAIQHCTALALYCSVICLEKRIRRRSGGDLLGGDMLLAEVQVWEEGHGLDVEEDAEDAEEDHSPAGNDHTEMEFFTLFRKEMFLKMVYTQIAFFRGIMNPAHLKRFLSKIFNFSSDSKDYIVFISNYWYVIAFINWHLNLRKKQEKIKVTHQKADIFGPQKGHSLTIVS